MAKELVF